MSACGKVSRVRHMVPGGSRESLPKRKVRFADDSPRTSSFVSHNSVSWTGRQSGLGRSPLRDAGSPASTGVFLRFEVMLVNGPTNQWCLLMNSATVSGVDTCSWVNHPPNPEGVPHFLIRFHSLLPVRRRI